MNEVDCSDKKVKQEQVGGVGRGRKGCKLLSAAYLSVNVCAGYSGVSVLP